MYNVITTEEEIGPIMEVTTATTIVIMADSITIIVTETILAIEISIPVVTITAVATTMVMVASTIETIGRITTITIMEMETAMVTIMAIGVMIFVAVRDLIGLKGNTIPHQKTGIQEGMTTQIIPVETKTGIVKENVD